MSASLPLRPALGKMRDNANTFVDMTAVHLIVSVSNIHRASRLFKDTLSEIPEVALLF